MFCSLNAAGHPKMNVLDSPLLSTDSSHSPHIVCPLARRFSSPVSSLLIVWLNHTCISNHANHRNRKSTFPLPNFLKMHLRSRAPRPTLKFIRTLHHMRPFMHVAFQSLPLTQPDSSALPLPTIRPTQSML